MFSFEVLLMLNNDANQSKSMMHALDMQQIRKLG